MAALVCNPSVGLKSCLRSTWADGRTEEAKTGTSKRKITFAPAAKKHDGASPLPHWIDQLVDWWFGKCRNAEVLKELGASKPTDFYLAQSMRLAALQGPLGIEIVLHLQDFITRYFKAFNKDGYCMKSVIVIKGGGSNLKMPADRSRDMKVFMTDLFATEQWKKASRSICQIQRFFRRQKAKRMRKNAANKIRAQWVTHKIRRVVERRNKRRCLLRLRHPKWYISYQKRIFLNVHYAYKEEAKRDYRAKWCPKEKCWYVWQGSALAQMAIHRYGKRRVQYKRKIST